MMSPEEEPGARIPGHHLASISHQGRFWDVYLEFEDDPRRPDSYRGAFSFSPADANDGETPKRTSAIIIEPSYEEALRKARSFDDHQLGALLRSMLP